MKFSEPYLLLLLLALPVLLFIRRRMRPSRPATFSSLELLASYRPTWRVRLRWIPTAVRAGALLLMVIALARPQVGRAENELPGQGIDIALVLDISSSMSSSQLGNESRLAVAQRVLTNFIKDREEDRLGLVVFRDDSLVLSPLTLDYQALQALVKEANRVNLNDGTAIGVALAESLNLLRESRAKSRIAILLTDGENNNITVQPLASARLAEALGIRLYTIGVTDSGRSSGATNVDERALREMADLTGGSYYRADSPETLGAIYENIGRLEKSRVGQKQYASYDELAGYFLGGCLALLLLELGLITTVWRRAS